MESGGILSMNILRGKLSGAKKVVIYGPEGIGKSTFASKFPEALFIDTEDSTKELDVARFEKPSSWEMLLQEVQYVIDQKTTCKTLVIDTADWAEKLCVKAVCAKFNKSGIESFEYGRGYSFAYETFGGLLNLLSTVIDKGIFVVLTAHAATKRREQPDEFGTYDCWGLKLIDTPKCSIANMVKEWSDVLLFANYKTNVVAADNSGKKYKAQGGRRTLYTSHHPCWDAKNRLGLPEEMPMDFSALEPYIRFPGEQSNISSVPKPSEMAPDPAPPKEEKQPLLSKKDDALKALRDLMDENLISDCQIQEAIADRGYFPIQTPLENLPTDFIEGVLIGAWPQLYQWIQEHDDLPF